MRHRLVLQENSQVALHMSVILGRQKVLSVRTQGLGVVAGRVHQRGPEHQGFERVGRRKAGKSLDLWPAGSHSSVTLNWAKTRSISYS
jgi:hypothetical protein